MSDERQTLTPEEAEAMLPDGASIHTFRNPGAGMLIGADRARPEILKALRDFTPELSGPAATAMHHGICLRDEVGWLFVETRKC